MKRSASKPKGKTVTEMTAKEFWVKRRRNPYEEDQDPTLVNRPFWNRFQFAIYFDVIKAKKNLYVDVRSIDTDAMEKDPEYFGEALQMCTQLNILRIMQFNKSKLIMDFLRAKSNMRMITLHVKGVIITIANNTMKRTLRQAQVHNAQVQRKQ